MSVSSTTGTRLYEFIGNVDDVFYFKTTLDAPRGRVLAIDIGKPGREHWREVLPQQAEPLEAATLVGGQADRQLHAGRQVADPRVHDGGRSGPRRRPPRHRLGGGLPRQVAGR